MKRTSKIVSLFLAVVLAISSFVFGDISAGAVSKIKSNKGDFYLSLKKSLYDGASSPSSTHTYKVYAFNVNSYSAKTCNKKLYNYYSKYYKSDYDAYVNGCSLNYGVYGSTYKNGNILSIKQKMIAPSWWSYKAYNINKKTGKKVTNESLFKKYGYTKKSFYNALKNKQISKTKSLIKQSSYMEQYADEMLAYAKSSESRKGLQVYLDSNGKLCAVAKIKTMVAADIYEYIFKFSKK
ncbi:MAG: hypothetical protein ACI4RM_03435 [Ruminococcus sp.]